MKTIHIKPSRKGLLHQKLGVPLTRNIPVTKLDAAIKSGDPALRKEAQFAKNARSWHKR